MVFGGVLIYGLTSRHASSAIYLDPIKPNDTPRTAIAMALCPKQHWTYTSVTKGFPGNRNPSIYLTGCKQIDLNSCTGEITDMGCQVIDSIRASLSRNEMYIGMP